MNPLATYIALHCKDFDVHIEPVDGSIFVEITHNVTQCYHNHNVCIGYELEGLILLRAEWELMNIRHEFNNEIH